MDDQPFAGAGFLFPCRASIEAEHYHGLVRQWTTNGNQRLLAKILVGESCSDRPDGYIRSTVHQCESSLPD
jgi:hypothetical protein